MSASDDVLRVAVFGAAGFVGGELLRLLLQHPRVGDVCAVSRSQAGKAWSATHAFARNLDAAPVFVAPDDPAFERADVVFAALGHGESQRSVAALVADDPRLLVDLAADFRIRDPDRYVTAYGAHARPELTADFRYALADVVGADLEGEAKLAAPGCFATATLLGLHPFRGLAMRRPPVSFAVTGSSGSGATPRVGTHHPFRATNFHAYSLEQHRHEAEIGDQLGQWGAAFADCRLLTHSGPFVRGIHATLHFAPAEPVTDPQALLEKAYAGSAFVRVLPEPPELRAVTGTNFAHLHATQQHAGEIVVTVVIDNLVKGAAGQAVQAMNLALGWPETDGLQQLGLAAC
jgi:N-acetyl-gamma-glutamyl-phosphate reductase